MNPVIYSLVASDSEVVFWFLRAIVLLVDESIPDCCILEISCVAGRALGGLGGDVGGCTIRRRHRDPRML